MIYCDRRIFGVEKWYAYEPEDYFMVVPAEVRKSVVFVGFRKADGSTYYTGTAFLVAKRMASIPDQAFPFAVTARHVIDSIKAKGINVISLRLNRKDGEAVWVDTAFEAWLCSPDPLIDVACMSLHLDVSWDHLYIPLESAATGEALAAKKVGPGDEVYITGLFSHHAGEKNNIPIVRTGNIAAMPQEKVSTSLGDIDAYLVEARSIAGISGSPVFVNVGGFRNGVLTQSQLALLGLMHGHFDSPSILPDVEDATGKTGINVGIGIVVPVEKILDVINHPIFKSAGEALENQLRTQRLPVNG